MIWLLLPPSQPPPKSTSQPATRLSECDARGRGDAPFTGTRRADRAPSLATSAYTLRHGPRTGAPATAAQRLLERVGGCGKCRRRRARRQRGADGARTAPGRSPAARWAAATRTPRHPWAHRRLPPLDRPRTPSPPKVIRLCNSKAARFWTFA
jgi:hypothetical protein